MSSLTYKTIQHAGLALSVAALMSVLEIGLGCLLLQPIQAVSLPLFVIVMVGNFLIAVTMPLP